MCVCVCVCAGVGVGGDHVCFVGCIVGTTAITEKRKNAFYSEVSWPFTHDRKATLTMGMGESSGFRGHISVKLVDHESFK